MVGVDFYESVSDELARRGFTFVPEYDSEWHTVTDENHGKVGYIATEVSENGVRARAITYKNFKSSGEFVHIKESPFSKGGFKKAFAASEKQAEAKRSFLEKEACHEAEKRIAEAQPCEMLPDYFKKKGFGEAILPFLKYWEHPTHIVFPVTDSDGKLWSVASIYLDDKDFLEGSRTSDCFHKLHGNSPDTNGPIYVCEGIATGLTIWLATGADVYCALSAHNLPKVCRSIRRANQRTQIVVCADNDQASPKNVGISLGMVAAEQCQAILRFPEFSDKSKTDFNDLMLEKGLDAVKKALSLGGVVSDLEFVVPLGFEEQTYYLTTSDNPQVIPFTEFSKQKAYGMMPKEYWDRMYGAENPKTGSVYVDYDAVGGELMEACRKRGFFKPDAIRGAGVWRDGDKTVVNLGRKLHFDGREHDLFAIHGKYNYVMGGGHKMLAPNPLQESEMGLMRDLLNVLRVSEEPMRVWLGGWIFGALICGSLKWRPHLLLIGEQGTGKSFIFQEILHSIFRKGFDCAYVKSNTTSAGIRQHIKNSCLPLLFDEFESTDGGHDDNQRSVLELFRQASVDDSSSIVKGSAAGKSSMFLSRFMGCMSGINTKVTNPQDIARFSTVELLPVVGEPEQYNELIRLVNMLDSAYCQRLFARAVSKVDVILKDIERVKSEVQRTGQKDRVGQQHGTLIACYYHLMHDAPLTDEKILEMVGSKISDNKSLAAGVVESDPEECLLQLLTSSVRVETADQAVQTILTGMGKMTEEERKKRNSQLHQFGLSIVSHQEEFKLAVAAKNPQLRKIYSGSRWRGNWCQSLNRIQGAEKNKVFKCGGLSVRGTLVPLPRELLDADSLESRAF